MNFGYGESEERGENCRPEYAIRPPSLYNVIFGEQLSLILTLSNSNPTSAGRTS